MANISIPNISSRFVNKDGQLTQAWFRVIEALISQQTFTGEGSPEGVLTAQLPAFYVDTDTNTLYLKTTSTGNTGWIVIS